MPASYYLDTSALGKRYVDETGSTWIRDLTASEAGNALLTARITMVEMYSFWEDNPTIPGKNGNGALDRRS